VAWRRASDGFRGNIVTVFTVWLMAVLASVHAAVLAVVLAAVAADMVAAILAA
jgi:hypothetical protein